MKMSSKKKLRVRPGTQVIPFSALSKQGRDEIYDVIDRLTGEEDTEEEIPGMM